MYEVFIFNNRELHPPPPLQNHRDKKISKSLNSLNQYEKIKRDKYMLW